MSEVAVSIESLVVSDDQVEHTNGLEFARATETALQRRLEAGRYFANRTAANMVKVQIPTIDVPVGADVQQRAEAVASALYQVLGLMR